MRTRRQRRRREQDENALSRVIREAKEGNDEAVAVLYRNHVGLVYGYFQACGVPEAEDLTAEVFVGMLRNLHAFNGGPNEFRAWLMTIAYRRRVDAGRRAAGIGLDLEEPQRFDALESQRPTELLASTIDPRLVEAFSALTSSQREVLALRFVADLGLERVAAITGRPVGAVKSMQHRALAALRNVLAGSLDESDQAVTK